MLAGNKNLTKFYDLIKVRQVEAAPIVASTHYTNLGHRNIQMCSCSYQVPME